MNKRSNNNLQNNNNNTNNTQHKTYKTFSAFQEETMTKYINKYKYPIPIQSKTLCDYITKETGVITKQPSDYNRYIVENKLEKVSYKTFEQRETNQHLGAHYLRSIAENQNIIENTHVVYKPINLHYKAIKENEDKIISIEPQPINIISESPNITNKIEDKHVPIKLDKSFISNRSSEINTSSDLLNIDNNNMDDIIELVRSSNSKANPPKNNGKQVKRSNCVTQQASIPENPEIIRKTTRYISDRPILDVNSTRIMQAGYMPIILVPNIEGADYERNRKTIAEVLSYNLKNNVYSQAYRAQQTKNKQRIDYDADYIYTIQTYNQTLQEFFSNDKWLNIHPYYTESEMKNILINLTDVIYYLTEGDIYDITQQLNDGTVIVGTMHIPKNFDTDNHEILTDKKEGMVTIRFEKNDDEVEQPIMLQQMDGNDHIYRHLLTWTKYTKYKQSVIANKSDSDLDYILKFIVTSRYDMGGTEYIRFKIVKITEPTFHDLLSTDVFNQTIEQYNMMKAAYDTYSTLSGVNKKRKLTELTNGDYFKAKPLPVTDTKTLYADLQKKYQEIFKRATKQGQNLMTQVTTTDSIVKKSGNRYYTYHYKRGTFLNLLRQFDDEMKYIENVTVEDDLLIQKITAKLLTYKYIGTVELKAMINYINREKPAYDINDHIIPLLGTIIMKTRDAELSIKSLEMSDYVNTINKFKNPSNFTKMQTSLWDAFLENNLLNYAAHKIRKLLCMDRHVKDNFF
jgi:hypothetical protein